MKKRSPKFLVFILVLLIINTVFFTVWYAFDMQGTVKGIVEREAGKALGGKFFIKSFNISDQQVFAEGITFTATDGSLNFNIENVRVRYNLLKFLFSGFKIRNILNQVEVNKADVSYILIPKPSKKAPKKLELPDLRTYFNDLKVINSSLKFEANIPLKISGIGILKAKEQLSQINITVKNTRSSYITLSARTANNGTIAVNGILDKGRLATSHTEIKNYIPLYVSHPDILNATTQIDLVLDASQRTKKTFPELDLKAIFKNTSALVLENYPVNIPLLRVDTNGVQLVADLSRSSVGSSSLEGRISLTDLQKELKFLPSRLDLNLDLNMLDPALQGTVAANLDGEGTISKPVLNLTAKSTGITYMDQQVQNIALSAAYKDEALTLNLDNAAWQNQTVTVTGNFNTKERKLTAQLTTAPISLARSELKVNASADLEVTLYSKLPEVKATVNNVSVAKGDLDQRNITGYVNLFPVSQGEKDTYYIDLDLSSPEGTKVSLIGDLLDRNLVLDASFQSLNLADLYPLSVFHQFDPVVTGSLSSFLTGNKVVVSTQLDLSLNNGLNYRSGVDLKGNYDLAGKKGMAVLQTTNGSLNDQPIDLELISSIDKNLVTLHSFKLNDQMFASGTVNISHPGDLAFELILKDLSTSLIRRYFPGNDLPEVNGINLTASYNLGGSGLVSAEFSVGEVKIPGIKPLSADLSFQGHPQQVEINGGIDTDLRRIVDLNGTVNLLEGLDLRLNAIAWGLSASDLMYSPLADGAVDCNVGIYLSDILTSDMDLSFDAQVISQHLSIPDIIDLDDMLVRITQTKDVLLVDTLTVRVNKLATIQGKGALDYNVLSNTYYEGGHSLDLQFDGLPFEWLDKQVDYITSASGKSSLSCTLTTSEDQFMVKTGLLDVTDGRITLKDQPETIRNIDIKADISDNRIHLNNFTCMIGDGKLTVQNNFEDDLGSHLTIAFLDLGCLTLKIDQPGALVSIPLFTAPRSISNVVIQGKDSEFATITGPFEDMHISGEVLIYNAEAVYPPNTDNLLSLIYSFRGALGKTAAEKLVPAPLPFTLDVMIRLVDNIKYTTYPANLIMQPGGFLHLVYDGSEWRAVEASFLSEQGSIDFFGTVFQAEKLSVSIIESQDLIDIEGSFYKRAADGTIITLTITTDTDTSKPILDRLVFNLKSDNPGDLTVTNILSRLRYSSSPDELSATQRGSLLQDEALSLISDNLNTSLIAPFLYPLENTIRRMLRLDNFSIDAGFIQNLFTETTSNPNQLGGSSNMNQFMGDIAQFSSSILLNNLSVSMSKYLGRKLFLDYQLTLQEATDLQNRTRLVVSHNTSLRWFLPQQFRLSYTFKYEPLGTRISHEIMLQRAFHFWGL